MADIVPLVGGMPGAVVDTLIDRLTTSSVALRLAALRPREHPFADRIDVTREFEQLLRATGDVVMDATIHPSDLLVLKPRPAGWLGSAWKWTRSRFERGERKAEENDAERGAEYLCAPRWLIVRFAVPGNIEFDVCYPIPGRVCFPPATANPKCLAPLDRQIIRAEIQWLRDERIENGDDEEEDSEDEAEPLLDFTVGVQRMAGPVGDFFGFGRIDLRLAMVEEAEHCPMSGQRWAAVVAKACLPGAKLRTIVATADGAEGTVDPRAFCWDTFAAIRDEKK
jgi:hypothetical protein